MDDALLAGDPADEQRVRGVRIDPVPLEGIGLGARAVLVRVDPVVDHVDPARVHLEVAEDVHPGPLAHRDDRVGHLDGRSLHPARDVVAAPELLSLPGPEGLERVGRHDEGDAVGELGHDAAEVRVPGVAVDDVSVDRVGHEGEIAVEGAEEGAQRLGRGIQPESGRIAPYLQRRPGLILLAERPDVDVDEPGQLTYQVLDVNAGAAVDVRRVLVGQDEGLHRDSLAETTGRQRDRGPEPEQRGHLPNRRDVWMIPVRTAVERIDVHRRDPSGLGATHVGQERVADVDRRVRRHPDGAVG